MSKFDVAGVQRHLTGLANSKLEKIEAFSSIASTNSYLLEQPAPGVDQFRVAIADHQTSGRGRHDRRWVSAPGSGLCLSFAYTFAKLPKQLPALTLAIGVAAIDALRELQIVGVSLKWPNDIVALDGKLGGILTEVRSGISEGVTVVTGIGLNLDIRDDIEFIQKSDWAHRAVDVWSLNPELPTRERLTGTIVEKLYKTCGDFEAAGFAGFADDWQRYDWLRGKEITVDMLDEKLTGIACGVDADGALLVDNEIGRTRVISGSIVMAGPTEVSQ